MRCCYQKDPKQLVISPRLKQNTCALLPAQTVADKYPPDRPTPPTINNKNPTTEWCVPPLEARAAFKEGAGKAKPIVMEPIMKVEVVTPEESAVFFFFPDGYVPKL